MLFRSGGTQLVQSLYVNGTFKTLVGGTYFPYTVSSTVFGNGYQSSDFNGNISELRYYKRVLTPMEIRTLYLYTYGKSGANAIIPTLDSAVSISPYTNSKFSPLNIPGCQLWLDAADYSTIVLQNGTRYVTQWNDKSGKGYNFTGTKVSGIA